MNKYLGIPFIVLGALILFISWAIDLVDYNAVQFIALGLMIVGLIVQIAGPKYLEKKGK